MTMYRRSDSIPHPEVGDDPLVRGSDQEDVDQDDLVAPIVSVSVVKNYFIKRMMFSAKTKPKLQMTWLSCREVGQ